MWMGNQDCFARFQSGAQANQTAPQHKDTWPGHRMTARDSQRRCTSMKSDTTCQRPDPHKGKDTNQGSLPSSLQLRGFSSENLPAMASSYFLGCSLLPCPLFCPRISTLMRQRQHKYPGPARVSKATREKTENQIWSPRNMWLWPGLTSCLLPRYLFFPVSSLSGSSVGSASLRFKLSLSFFPPSPISVFFFYGEGTNLNLGALRAPQRKCEFLL